MKPCPHCGKQVARLAGMNLVRGGYRHVWCDTEKGGCSATGGRADYRSPGGLSVAQAEEKAIELWNARPEEDRLREALECKLEAAELGRDEWQKYAKRLEWGIAHNAHRFNPRQQPRWAHVVDATGFGSSSAKVVCQNAGVDMDEEVGRLREAQNVCWHCKDCLLPGPRPRCENCPDECDVEDCDADGCVEDREALEPKEATGG